MGHATDTLFFMIIVDYKAGMNDSGNPQRQCEQKTEQETAHSACHQDSNGWTDYTEKESQRFHFFFFVFVFAF
jgi:hypothetical protein